MTPGTLDPDDVAVVVVTYHPPAGLTERLEETARQVGRVVVADNGSREEEIAPLERLAGGDDAVELIELGANRGVAAALDRGARRAADGGASWLLFLDQDTDPDASMVETLRVALGAVPDPGRLAVLGSNYREETTGATRLERDGIEPAGRVVERATVITSGSLVPTSVWRSLRGFREELFVDHVDDDFCLRARAEGLRVWITAEPVMTHDIGPRTRHRLPWRWTSTSNHAPIRRYYQTRNHAVLLREHLLREPRWAARTLSSRLKSLLLMLLFEDDRGRKLREMARGLVHAAAGRLGPHPRQPGARRPER